jgi:heme exporter protein A
MTEPILQASALQKTFNHRVIFFDVNFSLNSHEGLGIVGRNGAGKSTLAKIIAGVLTPSDGTIRYILDRHPVEKNDLQDHIGFVAPYLQMYDEFTGWENLDLARRMRGKNIPDERLTLLLKRVNLFERKHHLVRTYSSGMKQRLKYAFALLHEPPVLILDEPASNLDAEGIQIVREVMKEQIARGILIVATNDTDDLKYCTKILDLDVFLHRAKVPTT